MDSRGLPPEMSNFDCLPGRAGGTPFVLERAVRGDREVGHGGLRPGGKRLPIWHVNRKFIKEYFLNYPFDKKAWHEYPDTA